MNIEQITAYIIPVLIWILTIAITIRLVIKKQSVSAMLSWLMVIYVFPIVGIVAYLIFGEINLGKRRAALFNQLKPKFMAWFEKLSQCDNLVNTQTNLLYRPIFDLAKQRLDIPCVLGNELHILDTPESIMRSIIEDIKGAEKSINMVFYIWSAKGLVDEVMEALIAARQRGVEIRILLDSVGSRPFLKSQDCRLMQEQGIEITETLHVNLFRMFFSRIDLRQHRKIIVIDNQIAYTGSMNMVDPKFFKKDSNVGEWIDIMVRINGPVSAVLNGLHAWDWEIETGQSVPLHIPDSPLLPLEQNNSHAVQILATGPSFPDDLMAQSLAIAIFSARKSIVITSPYFVPSHNIAEALRIAALRGVEVSIILPKENDSMMVRWASRTFFDDLLAAGVKIYNFKKGLLHTKSMLIDNKLALVGTVNMDMRSFLLNFEVTMVVEDTAFANEISLLHEGYINNSELPDHAKWANRSVYQRIIEKLFFLFSPLL
ncbi:cardiolipin synthase [Aggregatibacter actinomycetemcomitans]|uniref:cardiolipin synthase n=1 Tax=Aggregatibacter actinomycetemcomitans TaxID=714 RepID=UPI00022BFD38|nr:cardiolipin synthase [Aggregatibacter actinomycetemcomitans]AEW77580.1 cardiolipin synthetase [Aggregatibacter actinomycetemcomitans ANH9381]KOE53395.1 cardiolipin synthetase [Aggregatibacter actinomycetemcomitans serotype b str. I23C]KOE57011.1 cardiolipin synthetase [Aggregatibacter actinomycetemcomitans serotype b str. S23A]UXM97436.1 cardiolipin synthase [Aggregatibacter actinomycetemcomitans]